jgi:gluconokinase
MKEYVIGIDAGTGSLKGLAVDLKGSVVTSSQFSYPLIHESDDRREIDPANIWQAFINCVRQILDEMGSNPQCIVLSTAMHSLIVIGDGGTLLTKMLTWADNRAGAIAQRLRKSASGEMLYEQTGTPIHAMSPLCKILWMKENDRETFNRAVKFISIKEFLWWKLFGHFEVDYSIASASGMMDIERLHWNENALSVAGIESDKLGRLVDTNFSRRSLDPPLAQLIGLSANTIFLIGGSDGCMANLGSFATSAGVAALTIGTSGAIRVASASPVYNFAAMTFNYRLDSETYICGGPTNNGGVVVNWYAENFLNRKLVSASDYNELFATLKSTEPGANGLIFLPYILGERAPVWDSDATGMFFGIRQHHTQAHFTRAVIEGISMALYNIAENMQKCGLTIDLVNVSGGFVHSNEWLQILANIFGKKMRLINASDASALGAAYLGLKTTGKISTYEELKGHEGRELHPEENVFAIYQKQYLTFQELYKNLTALSVQINN